MGNRLRKRFAKFWRWAFPPKMHYMIVHRGQIAWSRHGRLSLDNLQILADMFYSLAGQPIPILRMSHATRRAILQLYEDCDMVACDRQPVELFPDRDAPPACIMVRSDDVRAA